MRHSLFFSTFEAADQAEDYVKLEIGEALTDICQTNDGETGAIEVRFWTSNKLTERTMRSIVKATKPDVCAMNCED